MVDNNIQKELMRDLLFSSTNMAAMTSYEKNTVANEHETTDERETNFSQLARLILLEPIERNFTHNQAKTK